MQNEERKKTVRDHTCDRIFFELDLLIYTRVAVTAYALPVELNIHLS